jgi:hypothetical protein
VVVVSARPALDLPDGPGAGVRLGPSGHHLRWCPAAARFEFSRLTTGFGLAAALLGLAVLLTGPGPLAAVAAAVAGTVAGLAAASAVADLLSPARAGVRS